MKKTILTLPAVCLIMAACGKKVAPADTTTTSPTPTTEDNGIRMKTNRTRGGTVQYLTYSNLTMTNVSTPITLLEFYPDNTSGLS
ncbi:hypothetical protein FAM09_16000 [Niastella caeni]|uniref:Uncharacterized protein n=1 Tax=Niastella caeni TaxID=2569763 RepID=A0A4S8HY73_9BACT|nr:glycosyl hydrolase family 28 protein [Niastella caeni]THU38182.1 hypothetical protein FAM09_16000 [Niastella caeni]